MLEMWFTYSARCSVVWRNATTEEKAVEGEIVENETKVLENENKLKGKQNENKNKMRLTLSIISFVSLLTLFCGDAVPVKEMDMAEHAILRAESVKADKYAKEKYHQARNTLLAAHDLVSKSDYKDAKEKAKKAKALAKQAFEGAAPNFAVETKGEAKMVLGEVEERYAEQLAQAEYGTAQAAYKNAQDLIASGDKKFNEGKHMEAYADYREAGYEAEQATTTALAIAEKEAKLRPFKIWEADSNKILSIVNKLFPYTRDYNDLEFQEKEKKKLFWETLKKINKNLRNEGKHIKLEVVRLKEVSKITELTAYGEKYKARLRLKYPDSPPNKKPNRDWNWDSAGTALNLAESLLKLSMYSGGISLNERIKLRKVTQDYRAWDKIIKSKMAACKKCSRRYVRASFELPRPVGFCAEDSYDAIEESGYSSGSSYLISKECNRNDYDYANFKTNDIIIYAYLSSKFAPELASLKKGALYSLGGKFLGLEYERDGGKTTLWFGGVSQKSIEFRGRPTISDGL